MNAQKHIYIVGLGSVSALGATEQEISNAYTSSDSLIRYISGGEASKPTPQAPLSTTAQQKLSEYLERSSNYQQLDRTVQMALYCASKALKEAGWGPADRAGVVLGSSRGATERLEHYHRSFMDDGKVDSGCSPTTTLGNLSSWVAQELQLNGPASEISSTCSSSLYAIGMGLAWLKAGLSDVFLAGGTEAPLTAFTIAQMRALRIYARGPQVRFPCRPCEKEDSGETKFEPKLRTKNNTMVLGEGACVLALASSFESRNLPRINGAGFCVEKIKTRTSMSEQGDGIHEAMKQALRMAQINKPDLIVTHTPGTSLGDRSELTAILRLFGDDIPRLTSNKWKIGHTLGASGALSVEYALEILRTQRYCDYPYPAIHSNHQRISGKIRNIMVNSVGFGGNSGSLIISRD